MKRYERKYIIIIGAMKCGTTSLYEYLCDHPSICRCKTKEPNFFVGGEGHLSGKKEYKELWNFDPNKHKYCVEASTSYTKYPFNDNVPGNIKKSEVDPKFIYIVRDPVDRIESHYNFLNISKSENVSKLDNSRLIEVSKYFKQLERFLMTFPDRDNYLLLDFQNLIEEPENVLDKCQKFLRTGKKIDLKKKGAQNKTPRSKMDLWIKKTGWVKNAIGSLMSESSRRSVKKVLRKFSPKVNYRKINIKERKQLKEKLYEDMEKLKKVFGFNVEKWGF